MQINGITCSHCVMNQFTIMAFYSYYYHDFVHHLCCNCETDNEITHTTPEMTFKDRQTDRQTDRRTDRDAAYG